VPELAGVPELLVLPAAPEPDVPAGLGAPVVVPPPLPVPAAGGGVAGAVGCPLPPPLAAPELPFVPVLPAGVVLFVLPVFAPVSGFVAGGVVPFVAAPPPGAVAPEEAPVEAPPAAGVPVPAGGVAVPPEGSAGGVAFVLPVVPVLEPPVLAEPEVPVEAPFPAPPAGLSPVPVVPPVFGGVVVVFAGESLLLCVLAGSCVFSGSTFGVCAGGLFFSSACSFKKSGWSYLPPGSILFNPSHMRSALYESGSS
jgi:hypothetical protein